MTEIFGFVLTAAIAVVLIWLLVKLLKTPLKWAWKLLLNALGGFVSLFFLNLIGSLIGVNLDLTWVNAIVVGILGLPGVVLLIIIKYVL